MFKLVRLNDDKYSLIGKNISFEGNLQQTIRAMIDLGIEDEEVVMGMSALDEDEYAEYGARGLFLFSSNFNKKGA